MKFILILLCSMTTLLGSFAQADLLEKIKLEDAIHSRILQTARAFDADARVQIQFQYRDFAGALPGMAISEKDTFTPNKIEASDITRVNLQVFANFKEMPEEMLNAIYLQIPLQRNKVSMRFSEVKPTSAPAPVPVQAKDLNEIVDRTIQTLGKMFIFVLGTCLALVLGNSYLQTRKKLGAMKEQMSQLTSAVSENGTATPAYNAPAAVSDPARNNQNSAGVTNSILALENFSLNSVQEIFADAYWCQEDEYAHWLWKNVTNAQKKELLDSLNFMRAYSLHFINLNVVEKNYHHHPGYLEPLHLVSLSEDDLAAELRKNMSLFHQLTSLRQAHLPFTFQEKLRALNANPTMKTPWKNDKQSRLRAFTAQMQWGHLSEKDESVLFENSNIVPQEIKENIISLVWLAQRDDQFIRDVLTKYDARALSMAWIGPVEVLQKLETFIPEKKLKNLIDYRSKNAPNKNSVAFQSLAREGLKNAAA